MKKLLFVDDEPNVLQGLKRMLHPLRNEWEMHFIGSGAEALALMALEPIDVIITDMRMPGMDGVAVLNRAMKEHPHVVRIVLSGHSEHESILKAVGKAHQYLAKPCDTERLKAVVSRACSLRDLVLGDTVRDLVAGIQSLPSQPAIYQKLMTEVASENSSARRVGDIIATDPAMTARILQLVNSAFFGLPRRIKGPEEATLLLGLDTLRALVVSTHVFAEFADKDMQGFSIRSLQQHSHAVGQLAHRIARGAGASPEISGDVLTAGLLHDLGQLVLAANLPDRYREILLQKERENLPLWRAEQNVLGASHAEIGAYLLGLWGIPANIVEAVAYHHSPERCVSSENDAGRAGRIVDVVWAADMLIRERDGSGMRPEELEHLARNGLGERIEAWRVFRDDLPMNEEAA